jgi:hypothetical protein
MNLAFNWFLHCKDLVVLLYSETGNDAGQVGNADGSIVRSNGADQMVVVAGVGRQRTALLHVGVDDELEVDGSDAPQGTGRVMVHDTHKALISHRSVLVRSNVESTNDASVLHHQHHRMDRGKSNVKDLPRQNQHSFQG